MQTQFMTVKGKKIAVKENILDLSMLGIVNIAEIRLVGLRFIKRLDTEFYLPSPFIGGVAEI